ncbi:hypothetical protein AJ80_00784 [Polytolypa hystricis UAMH7299]|uniref:Membrane insertase YidC/Oxa/ALB C-terminal domain-containing protein n=1 Tax=Polytolypa hystricis (strain UAMH7299) TaxID=1447883 RepID=A0A2B7Z2U4_POLH7|nr:hypothetical protein AJ80_00784 [Polytolypa hystricis UAMH7299]
MRAHLYLRPASFARFPSQLRSGLRNQGPAFQQSRLFHPSQPCRLLDTSVTLANGLLEGVHSVTGLPWVVSIPLTALIVRSTIAWPLQVWAHRQYRQKAILGPILVAWSRRFQDLVMLESFRKGEHIPPAVAEKRVLLKNKAKKRDLYKRWGLWNWSGRAPMLQLPIWLCMMESIRRMVGMQDGGILTIITKWLDSNANLPSIPTVQSMASEGALWFPDLLAYDPILPIFLSATLLSSIHVGFKVKPLKEIRMLPMGKERTFATMGWSLRRGAQIMSVLLIPIMHGAQAPAGLAIYWISSSSFATMQALILKKVIYNPPIPKVSDPKAVRP